MTKEEVRTVLNNLKTVSNKEIIRTMAGLRDEFEKIKDVMIKLSNSLDEIEKVYGAIYSEFLKREGK